MEELYSKVQSYLDQQPNLKFEVLEKFSATSTLEAVKEFFQKNNSYDTIFADSNLLQCWAHKRRSIGDIYKVIKFYMPNTTIEEVKSALEYYIDKEPILRSIICPDINKRVWRMTLERGFMADPIDEFGMTYNIEAGNYNRYHILGVRHLKPIIL